MSTTVSISHVIHLSVDVSSDYVQFTTKLESILGRLDFGILSQVMENPEFVKNAIINQMQGAFELILFNQYDHGSLLNIWGKPRKAKQYLIGNPYTASTMTRFDIRAGLYAPLRVLVFERDDKKAQIEYDLPSSLFGQFGIPEVTSEGIGLDRKMERLINETDTK
jgi:hypothetical protein